MIAKKLLTTGGVILAIAGAFGAIMPAIGYQWTLLTSNDQMAYLVLQAFVDLIRVVLPPVATAFLGAGLVVLYFERRDSPESGEAGTVE